MDDRLSEIVAKQKAIADRFMDLKNMTLEEREKQTQQFLLAIIAEVGEILNGDDINGIKGQGAIRWKSWKTQQTPADSDYVKTELCDILHFVLELMLIWGCDADEIYNRYMNKNKENIKRYDSGY